MSPLETATRTERQNFDSPKYSFCQSLSASYVQQGKERQSDGYYCFQCYFCQRQEEMLRQENRKISPLVKSIATGRSRVKTLQRMKNLCRFLRGCFCLIFLENNYLFSSRLGLAFTSILPKCLFILDFSRTLPRIRHRVKAAAH